MFSWCSYCCRTQERTSRHWFSSASAWSPNTQKASFSSAHLRTGNRHVTLNSTAIKEAPLSSEFVYRNLSSSASALATFSKPLQHVSKVVWKSLWTIMDSAAQSSMSNSRDTCEDSGGGEQQTETELLSELLLLMTPEEILTRLKTNKQESLSIK